MSISFTKLKRSITLSQATTMGLGALIGAGIFVLAGPAVALTGANVILVYLLAALSAFIGALSYAELSSAYDDGGGGYFYTKSVLGERYAFIVGWLLITGSTVACAVYALGFANFLSLLWDVPITFSALLILFSVSALNIFGVEKMAQVEFYFTAFLCVFLIIFGGSILMASDFSSFHFSFSPVDTSLLLQGVNLVYISFFGFQVIATSAQEIVNPRKNLPTAILISSIFASFIYLIIIIGLAGMVNESLLSQPEVLLQRVSEMVWGRFGAMIMTLLALIATFTSLNATVHAVSRRVYRVANDRFIPQLLAHVHPRFRTPHLAICFIALLCALLILVGDLLWAANVSAFAYLISLITIHIVMIVARKKHSTSKGKFHVPFFPLVPILGILINAGILFMLEWTVLLAGALWIALGIVLFEILRRREKGLQKVRLLYGRMKLLIRRRGNL